MQIVLADRFVVVMKSLLGAVRVEHGRSKIDDLV
jgi:hypothetical protein